MNLLLNPGPRRSDIGLLVLRMVAFFLLVTFGWEKFRDLVMALVTGKSLAASGLAPLIGKMGFPLPVVLAVGVALLESVGALLIAIGFYTRLAALCGALSMAGAFYTSAHFGWEPLRSFLYMFTFLALVFTGAGKFSLDSRLSHGSEAQPAVADVGLLLLRLGILIAFVMLFTVKAANGYGTFPYHPAALWLALAAVLAGPVVVGCYVRVAGGLSALFWLSVSIAGLLAGQHWDLAPYRGFLFVLLFVALSFTGPGRFSVDRGIR